MSETIKILDDEVTLDTIRMEVLAVGMGMTVTVTLQDEDGTAILAKSRILPSGGLEDATEAGKAMIQELKAMAEESVAETVSEGDHGVSQVRGDMLVAKIDLEGVIGDEIP